MGTSQVGTISTISKAQQIKSKRGPFGDKKIEKKLHSAEKTERGDPLVPSGFVGYV